jgi:hypothetical protein
MLDLSVIDDFEVEYEPHCPARVLAEPTRQIAPVNPHDPSMLGYPPTLIVEIALKTTPLPDVLDSYGISPGEWEIIREDPTFLTELARTMEMLKEEGAGFKMKARLQAEALLQTSWNTIHHALTPPAVKADLIKSTMKWSGYDVPPSAQQQVAAGAGFSISINFNGNSPRVVSEQ